MTLRELEQGLAAFFPASDIEWRPMAVSKKTSKALAAAYITNRAIQDRLDKVCGATGWYNEYLQGPEGGVLCGLSIKDPETGEWVTKWDGAENTEVEAVKGGLSGSMKRAASMWGIGRYLYKLPSQWVAIDDRGRFTQTPQVPREFLPPEVLDSGRARKLAQLITGNTGYSRAARLTWAGELLDREVTTFVGLTTQEGADLLRASELMKNTEGS